ncbi:MAG: S8 family serine peptidase [Sphingobacteriales bacterium]|jgi:serine protease AprX
MRGMIKFNCLLAVIFFCVKANAQYTRHIIQFSYKGPSKHSLSAPSTYLSERAIKRRSKYQITLDSTDLPISDVYLDSIKRIPNISLLSSSKWLNQVLVQTSDSSALKIIRSLSFVKSAFPIATKINRSNRPDDKFSSEYIFSAPRSGIQMNQIDPTDYGNSFGQINIHEGEYLHNNGFMGQGITIAMLDAGYLNYTTVAAFDSLRKNNQILGTWDFVKNEVSVSEDDAHGLYCLSIMAGNLPGRYLGTAPKASYYLFRTEDVATEFPIEEHYWAAAAERADSLGVDMISSSLGYTEFDDPRFNYTYQNMNGNSTIVTRAADLASKKGILVCNSAGNSGGSTWKYIAAPADGDSVLAIGATNVNGVPAWFSSYGPSANGKIKPDVASVGDDTYIITPSGNIARGDGTSFSNPNLAGLIACLWQAFPEYNNMEIMDAVKKSASKYNNPDNRIGYGIPNMRKAFQYLLEKKFQRLLSDKWIKAFPNPFQSEFAILIKPKETGILTFQLLDISGRIYQSGIENVTQDQFLQIRFNNLGYLPKGIYYIRIINGRSTETIPILK